MSHRSADWRTLPSLPRRQIIESLLDELGFAKIIVLRSVCGWFNYEILDAIMARKLICMRLERDGYSNRGSNFPIPGPILAKLLLHRLRRASPGEVRHLHNIDRVAQSLRRLCEPLLKEPEDAITEAVLAGAVSHLKPGTAVDMMIGECGIFEPSSDESYHMLAAAALLGQLDAVSSLVRKGVDVNMRSAYLGTPLKAAAGQGRIDVVRFLLEHGAHDSSTNKYEDFWYHIDEDTALGAASRRGHFNIVKLLLEPKHEYKTEGVPYHSAILGAVKCGHSDLPVYLLSRCTSLDIEPLLEAMFLKACAAGNLAIIHTMLASGIDVNESATRKGSILEKATTDGKHIRIMCLSPERACEFRWSWSIISALALAVKHGHLEATKILLDSGAEVNVGYKSRFCNPLFEAVFNQHTDITRLLLDRGADINCEEEEALTLLDASRHSSEEIGRILEDAGVPININERPHDHLIALGTNIQGHAHMAYIMSELGAESDAALPNDWRDQCYATVDREIGQMEQSPPPPILKS